MMDGVQAGHQVIQGYLRAVGNSKLGGKRRSSTGVLHAFGAFPRFGASNLSQALNKCILLALRSLS